MRLISSSEIPKDSAGFRPRGSLRLPYAPFGVLTEALFALRSVVFPSYGWGRLIYRESFGTPVPGHHYHADSESSQEADLLRQSAPCRRHPRAPVTSSVEDVSSWLGCSLHRALGTAVAFFKSPKLGKGRLQTKIIPSLLKERNTVDGFTPPYLKLICLRSVTMIQRFSLIIRGECTRKAQRLRITKLLFLHQAEGKTTKRVI